MLLPFVAFVVGCVIFSIAGSVVLARLPQLRPTLLNRLVFVVGAFPGAAAFGYLHEIVFADSQHELHSVAAVLGFFTAMGVGAILGGTTLIWIKTQLTKRIR